MQSFKQLIKHILLVDLLQTALVNGTIEICVHELKHDVDISARFRWIHLKYFDDVLMFQLLEE